MIRKLLLQVGFILIWLGVLAPLPVQAQSLTVSFEVTKVTPVNVTVKAVVSGTTGTYPVKILLQDTSARVNSVKVNKLVTIPRKEAVIVGNQSADYFTIVALPDTQFYSQDYPDIYDSQTQWIADNRDAENIVMVVHLGDIVNNWDVVGEWANAKDSMDILRSAGVPYTVVPGNHDAYYADLENGDANYNAYFPYTDFQNDSWHGGHFPENKYTSNYQLISFGEEKYILLNLVGNMPFTHAATGWANNVLYRYNDYKAIVVTHAYIDTSGNKVKYEPSSVDPPYIWDNIVKMHSNIVAVWSGNYHGEYYNADVTPFGNTVHNLLADYQERTYGGDGWLRLYRFYPSESKMSVLTYSPYLNQWETDADSQFDITSFASDVVLTNPLPKFFSTVERTTIAEFSYGQQMTFDISLEGTSQYEIEVNLATDSRIHPDTGKYGRRGILALDINGAIYKDLSSSSWWNTGWNYRNVLLSRASSISQNLTNYPVQVRVNSSNHFDFSKIKAGGADIRFVDRDDATVLNYEIEYWDDTAEDAVVWVKVPQIDAGTQYTDYIYVYYGNPEASDAQNKNATWADTGAVGVWHFDEMAGLYAHDSTSSSNTGTLGNGPNWENYAVHFNGSDDQVQMARNVNFYGGSFTVLAWFNADTGTNHRVIVSQIYDPGTSNGRGWSLFLDKWTNGRPRALFYNGVDSPQSVVSNSAFSADTQVVLRFDASTSKWNIFLDGAKQTGEVTYSPSTDASGAYPFRVGRHSQDAQPFDGLISEVRVYNIPLSDSAIKADDMNRLDTLFYYGGIDPPPTLLTLSATDVYMDGGTHATLRANLIDLGTAATGVDIWFEWGYSTGYGNTINLENVSATGMYTYDFSGYSPDRTVHYRFVGKNGDGTTYGGDVSFKVSPTTFWTVPNTLPIIFSLIILFFAGWVILRLRSSRSRMRY